MNLGDKKIAEGEKIEITKELRNVECIAVNKEVTELIKNA